MSFLKRKITIFGKSISMLVIVLLATTVVTAAVVPYLSNTLTGKTTVKSPMACWADGYDGTSNTLNMPAEVFANGDPFSFDTYCKSMTNARKVYGIMIKITAPTGTTWDGTEFDGVTLSDGTLTGEILPNLCIIKDDGTVIPFADIGTLATNVAKLVYSHDGTCTPDSFKFDYVKDSQVFNRISITPGPMYEGEYSVSMCYISKLKGADCKA
jgi:hypothetical protein